MKPILYESTETNFNTVTRTYGLGVLSDTIRCSVTETLNGSFELEMEYPITGIHYSDIQCDRIILVKTKPRQTQAQAFRIYAISRPMNGIVEINAKHLSYDLSDYVVQPKFSNDITVDPVTAENVQDAFEALYDMSFPVDEHGVTTCPFTFDSDIPYERTFSITKPGTLRSFIGNNDGALASVYSGEWSFDNYNCYLHNKRGEDNGVKIRYGINLKDITQEENIEEMYTAVYPFAVHTNGSLTYVYRLNPDDPDDVAIDPDAPLVKADGGYDREKVLPLDVSSNYAQYAADRISTEVDTSKSSTASGKPTNYQLYNAAVVYMEENDVGKPKINITLSFIDVAEFLGTGIFHSVDLGDTVHVYFEKLGVEKDSRCIKAVYNVLLDRYDSLELGDTASTLASTVANASSSASRASTNATQAQTEASAATVASSQAIDSARVAGVAAAEAKAQALSAQGSADAAGAAAASAETAARSATTSANNALSGLATLENVVDTVNWFAEHKTASTDTTVNPAKSYYIYDETTGTLSLVEPDGTENPSQEGWYELSQVISNYLATHVSESNDGLSVVGLSNGWRVLVSSGAGTYAAGIFLIDPNGNIAQASTASGITFDENKPFYIGDNNSYINFDGNGHVTINGNVTLGPNKTMSDVLTDLETALEQSVEYIVGTQTGATGSWTGVTMDSELVAGKTIAYKLPYAGSGNASLNLTLAGGGTTGPKAVYTNTTRVTTHFGANAVINMTYDGTYWRANSIPNTDTIDRVNHNGRVTAAEAITKNHTIVGTASGYKQIAANVSFDLSYPILYATADTAANAYATSTYERYPNVSFANDAASISGFAVNKILFLKGTVSDNTFTIASNNHLTCTVPSTEDGYCYIPLGVLTTNATSANGLGYFSPNNILYTYKDGAFGPVSIREAAAAAKVATNYLTDISNDGVFVHEASSTPVTPSTQGANGVHITDVVDIIRNGTVAATYGEGVILYDSGSPVAIFSGDGIVLDPRPDTQIIARSPGHVHISRTEIKLGEFHTGYGMISEHFEGDGVTTTFSLELTPVSLNPEDSAVLINSVQVTEGWRLTEETQQSPATIVFDTAPISEADVMILYKAMEHSYASVGESVVANKGMQSFTIGPSGAGGKYALAQGDATNANGEFSSAFGSNTYAYAKCSSAFGLHTRAYYDNEFVIGKYNIYNAGQKAFIIGNGTEPTPSNALTVDWDGNVNAAGNVIAANTSHVGMIIHSTTLDTEAKVKAIYGGTSWIRHSGYFLYGAISGVTANSAQKDGGETDVTLTAAQSGLPAHGHGFTQPTITVRTTYEKTAGNGTSRYHIASSGSTSTSFVTATASGGAVQDAAGVDATAAHNNMPPYKNVYIWERVG